ncbi:kinetochore Spc24-like [Chlorella sorokiniana]|uniref:Kinetochore protein Spc24 n=1 Tax=Chlorella sorokiniana TaxID=3076 RepID=A0A2P6TTY8_CHLSO|nr:kinetochore Spc24-like [Chlorella sorokiniana]|eukprot:PRW57531.1 kinetochore Spc24-like [Chlorella sorokiniana]
MAAQFAEHLSVISALKDNYTRPDDAQAVASVVRSQQNAAAACSQREDEVKEAIKELTGRVRSVEREAAYPHKEGAHAAQVAALSTASAVAHENVDALNRQLQALQAQRTDIKTQVAALQRKADHIEQIVTDAEPRTRHQLSLYAHVSKITWQFEAPARVAGTVANPMRTFDFDPATTPNFDIVNALWELMGTDDA